MSPYAIAQAPSAPNTGMGANVSPGGGAASFRVWAPNASRVDLLVRPDAVTPFASLPLEPDALGSAYYSADVTGVAPGHRYRFQITNSHSGPNNPGGLFDRIDPYARDIVNPDAASPAVIVDP